MFEESDARLRNRRLKKAIGLASFELRALDERKQFVEHKGVLRRLDILGDGIGQPGAIVRNTGPDALTGMR